MSESNILIPVYEGCGSFIKGDLVKWCDGLNGTVISVFMDLITIETDDGITRLAGERYITHLHENN